MRYFFLVAAHFSLILVCGCATDITHEIPLDYVAGSDPDYGIVIGSVGARPAPQNPPWYEWSRYDFRSLTDPQVAGHILSAFEWNPFYMWGSMTLCPDDNLEPECGHLFALRLPAGEYEFQQVIPAMMSFTTAPAFNQRGWNKVLTDYTFTVEPGQIVYIGNLLSRICIGSKFGKGNSVLSAVGNVEDMSARDVPLLVAKYPQLAGRPVTSRPLRGSAWLWRLNEQYEYVPPYGWPPECSLEPDNIQRYLRYFGPPASR